MLSITKESVLAPEEVIKRVIRFFGPKGLGLKITTEEADHVYLEGGGGFVEARVYKGPKGSKLDVETREWESQAKDLMFTIK
jgi:hypothetical protein